jgi:phosphoribosyl-AMP cyclohydrolase
MSCQFVLNRGAAASERIATAEREIDELARNKRIDRQPVARRTVSGPDFSKHELIPVIAQDNETGEVLMLAYMNEQAYEETLRTSRVVYYSRSRNRLWRKGEESGHVQELRAAYFDCDADTLLVKVHQIGGAACHEGFRSCFFRRIDPLSRAVTVVGERVFDPAQVYKKS